MNHLAERKRSLTIAAIALSFTIGACAQDLAVEEMVVRDTECVVDNVAYTADEDGFGCATSAILHRMVANPADLESPQELAPPEGDVAVAPVRRYRLDEVKPLPGNAPAADGAPPEERYR